MKVKGKRGSAKEAKSIQHKIKNEAQTKVLMDMFEEMGFKVVDVTPKKK